MNKKSCLREDLAKGCPYAEREAMRGCGFERPFITNTVPDIEGKKLQLNSKCETSNNTVAVPISCSHVYVIEQEDLHKLIVAACKSCEVKKETILYYCPCESRCPWALEGALYEIRELLREMVVKT